MRITPLLALVLAACAAGAGCAGNAALRAGEPVVAADLAGLRLENHCPWVELDPGAIVRTHDIARDFCAVVLGGQLPELSQEMAIVVRADGAHQDQSHARRAGASFGFYLPGQVPQISISDLCWNVDRNVYPIARDLSKRAVRYFPYGILGHELVHAYLDAADYRAPHSDIYPWAVFQLVVERLATESGGNFGAVALLAGPGAHGARHGGRDLDRAMPASPAERDHDLHVGGLGELIDRGDAPDLVAPVHEGR